MTEICKIQGGSFGAMQEFERCKELDKELKGIGSLNEKVYLNALPPKYKNTDFIKLFSGNINNKEQIDKSFDQYLESAPDNLVILRVGYKDKTGKSDAHFIEAFTSTEDGNKYYSDPQTKWIGITFDQEITIYLTERNFKFYTDLIEKYFSSRNKNLKNSIIEVLDPAKLLSLLRILRQTDNLMKTIIKNAIDPKKFLEVSLPNANYFKNKLEFVHHLRTK